MLICKKKRFMDIKRLFFCGACSFFFSGYLMLSAKNADEVKIPQEANRKLMECTDKICSLLDQGCSAEEIAKKFSGGEEPSHLLREFVRQVQASNKQCSKEIAPNIVINIMQDKGANDLTKLVAINSCLSIIVIILEIIAICLIVVAAYYLLPQLFRLLLRWLKQLFDWLRFPFAWGPGIIRGPAFVNEYAADDGQIRGGNELLHGNDSPHEDAGRSQNILAQPLQPSIDYSRTVRIKKRINDNLCKELDKSLEDLEKSIIDLKRAGVVWDAPPPGALSVVPFNCRTAREILEDKEVIKIIEEARRSGILPQVGLQL